MGMLDFLGTRNNRASFAPEDVLASPEDAMRLPRNRDALRRYYKAQLAERDVRDERKVKAWRTTSRVTLALLFGFSALQYYLLDVSLTIMSLRGVTVFVAY